MANSTTNLPDSLKAMLDSATSEEELAVAFYEKANYYELKLEPDSAIKYYGKAQGLYKKIGKKEQFALCLLGIGRSYLNKDKKNKATGFHLRALEILEKENDSLNLVRALINTSFLYMEMEQFPTAEKFNTQALAIAYNLNDLKLIMDAELSRAIYLRRTGKHKESVDWNLKALETSRKINNPVNILNSLITTSTAYGYLEDYDSALEYALEAMELGKKHATTTQKLALPGQLGWLYVQIGDLDKGLKYCLEGLSLSREVNDVDLIKRYTRTLARIYRDKGDFKNAFSYYAQFVNVLEESQINQTANEIAEMTAKYETDKKQRELEAIKREKQHEKEIYEAKIKNQRIVIYSAIGGALLLIAFIILIINSIKQKAKAKEQVAKKNTELKEKQALLDGQDAERTRIAQELHDGLGGSLASIKMRLNSVGKDQSDALNNIILDVGSACQEVRSISHNLLSDTIKTGNLTNEIINYVSSRTASTTLKVNYEFFPEEEINNLEDIVQHNVYRIIQELVNNAVKYAKASYINIGIIKDEEGISILVEDDGKGFDMKNQSNGGIGIKNITKRVNILQGKITYTTSIGKGCTVNIQFPQTT